MENNKLNIWIRIALIICALALVAVLFVPMWRIELSAPQYPEGLRLLIFPDKLGGNVDIINGLNHYIGMKTLHTDDFIEFTVLPYLIMFFVSAFIITALINRKKILYLLFFLFIGFAIVSMVDFWRWEYNYGHNLDPNAAIVVPGQAYQPPLIGFKQLLNFGAYSIPATGGWIFVGVGIILLLCTLVTWKSNRKKEPVISQRLAFNMVSVFILTTITSCNTDPEPLRVGKDNCYFCKMTISDIRFGSEIITKKGKIYKFDDVHCTLEYLKTDEIKTADIKDVYLTNFCKEYQLINVNQSHLLHSENLRSPMGGNIAAFNNIDSLKKIQEHFSGTIVNWAELNKP